MKTKTTKRARVAPPTFEQAEADLLAACEALAERVRATRLLSWAPGAPAVLGRLADSAQKALSGSWTHRDAIAAHRARGAAQKLCARTLASTAASIRALTVLLERHVKTVVQGAVHAR